MGSSRYLLPGCGIGRNGVQITRRPPLQPPFFDPHADDAVNYGGIGAVIGHEISHGFDDQGSKFGPTGSLDKWWMPEDRKKFEVRTAALSTPAYHIPEVLDLINRLQPAPAAGRRRRKR